jgi:hypothetical protein
MPLTTDQMKDSSNLSGFSFNSIWQIREDSTYPALRAVENNAPFAFSDTFNLKTSELSLADLLSNDYDMEMIHNNLVLKVLSVTQGVTTDSTSIISFPAKMAATVKYRIGEIRIDNNDTLWGNIAVAIIKAAPSAPAIVSPEDNAVNVSLTPEFAWTKEYWAESYHLQIAIDSLFTFNADTVLIDTICRYKALDSSTKYFWRVKASNTIDTSEWSAIGHFSTYPELTSNNTQSIFSKKFDFKSLANGIIKYELPQLSHVSIKIYGINGQCIYVPVCSMQPPGYYTMRIDRQKLARGCYIVKFNAGIYNKTEVIHLTK